MSFLTETIARRVLPTLRTTAIPRATFTSSALRRKTVTETAKDTLKTVDRKVSDKLVDGLNASGK